MGILSNKMFARALREVASNGESDVCYIPGYISIASK